MRNARLKVFLKTFLDFLEENENRIMQVADTKIILQEALLFI